MSLCERPLTVVASDGVAEGVEFAVDDVVSNVSRGETEEYGGRGVDGDGVLKEFSGGGVLTAVSGGGVLAGVSGGGVLAGVSGGGVLAELVLEVSELEKDTDSASRAQAGMAGTNLGSPPSQL